MPKDLSDKRVAILVANGFEQIEMTSPREVLEKAGAETDLISIEAHEVKGWKHTQWGDTFDIDVWIDDADSDDYDALLLPGGVMSPDKLRRNEKVQEFVRAIFEEGKPVAAICHGPWTLIDAGVAKGRRMTSYPSIQMDLKNAGVKWTDEEVVVDQGLVTSRSPDDLPAFNDKMIEEFAEGRYAGRRVTTGTSTG
ncbi:MAG: type 1 glutamine amidotransferase domain-containing protein [Gemmatimonadota bacterium]